jgi:hypothetical protein
MSLYATDLLTPSPIRGLPPFPSPHRLRVARCRDRYRSWTSLNEEPEMAGLGRAFKRLHKTIRRVALAPVRLVSKKLMDKIESIDDKVVNKVDDLHTGINRFAKRNMKWIVLAAAIAITIYSMGSGAGIAAKMLSGLSKLKALVAAKGASGFAWGQAKGALAKAAMGKLLAGKTFGSLHQDEVTALAETNAATGEEIVPPEVMGVLRPAGEGVSGGSLPGWALPAAGVGLLALLAL